MIESVKILVVGATGYIGSKLRTKAKVKLDVLGTSSNGGNLFLPLRLDKPKEFDFELVNSSSVVLLTAAISSPDICAREHARAWAVNVTGTSEFIEEVISRGGRVAFFSSDTVYGDTIESRNSHDSFASRRYFVVKQVGCDAG